MAVHTATGGKVYMSPDISSVLVQDYVQQGGKSAPNVAVPSLSPREREVLQLLAEGHNVKQIAGSLNVSAKTVETHRRRIMEKLDIHSVAELTKYAIKQGFTSLDT